MSAEILNIKEVAEFLRVAGKTVHPMPQTWERPASKVRAQLCFRRADLEGWITAQRRATRSKNK